MPSPMNTEAISAVMRDATKMPGLSLSHDTALSHPTIAAIGPRTSMFRMLA
jgi:hypothetical protein